MFVERDRTAFLRALDANLDALGLAARAWVVTSDVLAVVGSIDADIVFADPPYDFDEWPRLLGAARADLVVAESGRPVGAVAGWEQIRAKKYGRTTVTTLERVTVTERPPE